MDELNLKFLKAIFEAVGGEMGPQASMYDVGRSLGLAKEKARQIGEDLIGAGLLEIRTLSGAVSLTEAGLAAVKQAVAEDVEAAASFWGEGLILAEAARPAVRGLIQDLQEGLASMKLEGQAVGQLVADLATLSAQLLSPRPKTAIVKAALESVQEALAAAAPPLAGELKRRVAEMLG